jgi:AraC-like DNA-binding protein
LRRLSNGEPVAEDRKEVMSSHQEWTRYYHDPRLHGLEVLHAHFVDHRYARHAHDYFVIASVDSGAASYWYRGAQRVASVGQVFVINPDEPHTGDPATPGGYVYRVLYPRPEQIAQLVSDIGSSSTIPFFRDSVLRDTQLSAMLSRFHQDFAGGSSSAACEDLLLRSLELLITRHTDPRITPRTIGSERPAIRRACEYINSHYAQDLSLSKLADVVSLSPYYFARAFEREVGLPPHAYLENVRVQKARGLLDGGHSIVSTAMLTGYVDQSHLTHRFKRFLGITPGQYLRNRRR